MSKRILVVEGGGMKGAYANGVLGAFEEEDHHPWDAVIGTSAGGALAAWYSAGQAKYAYHTWPYARDKRVLSYARGLTGRGPLLDHEALLEIVYVEEHPIDQEAIRRCPWPVIVTAADIDTGACVYQDIREGDIISWLKATGRLPFASGPPVTIDGRSYVDGGALDPIPIRYAVEHLGGTDITLLLNKQPRKRRPDPRILTELAGRRYPKLRDGIVNHQAIKQASVEYAQEPPAGVRIDLVHPNGPTGLSRFSRDLEAIEQAIRLGERDGRAYVASRE